MILALALVIAAECFVARSLEFRRGVMMQPHATELRHLPSAEMRVRNKGDNMVGFGKYGPKYADEKTWDEVLTDDPGYCRWVLKLRGPRFLSYPGARELQDWLREQQGRDNNVVWLFHYTDTASAKSILSSHCMLPSIRAKTGDAHEGDGIYFTSLQQDTPYAILHENNYDGARRMRGQEAYVRVRRKKLPGVVRASTDRDVWILRTTKPLDLENGGGEGGSTVV